MLHRPNHSTLIPCPPGPSLARFVAVVALAATAVSLTSCGDDEPPTPPSLSAPEALAKATRSDCGDLNSVLSNFNDANGKCAIGLVANTASNRLAVSDLGREAPSLADLDPSIPAPSHIPVGRHPVDVATTPGGTAAYTLNSVDDNLTVVDLWRLETVGDPISLPSTARALTAGRAPSDGGRVVVALVDPNQLWNRPGVHCRGPASSEEGCSNLDAESETISLPGRPADVVLGPRGGRAFVVYQNRNFLSVIAFETTESLEARGLSCRGNRSAPPCEVRRTGLTYGCSDGVDNDGDGRLDRADPQCWGPKGAESRDGAGRKVQTVCNDGVDNDGDGTIDRNDEKCQGAADDSERELLQEEASFPCDNGADDDGDGAADYPDDSSCYGAHGRTESALEATGFESVHVDRMGAFAYVVDRTSGQLLVIDAERMELVDAGTAISPASAPFNSKLGITVGRRPAVATGLVSRSVQWTDPDDASHGIVGYSFGAYVASDNGSTYFVETFRALCEVREPSRDALLASSEFRLRSDEFRNSAERSCLIVPEFPLDKTTSSGTPVDACEQADACLACVRDDTFQNCRAKCEDFTQRRDECRAAGREFIPSMQTRLVVNPKFGLGDQNPADGRISTRGQCNAPERYVTAMRNYTSEFAEAPRNFSCNSPLRPQPLTPDVSREELEGNSFDSVSHGRLLPDVTLQLRPPSEDNDSVHTRIETRTADFRYRSETWTVTWEGILPDTNRKDGLLARETREIERDGETQSVVDFDPGGTDLCSSGVRKGDRLLIESKPKTGDEAPDTCSNFVPGDSDDGGDTDTIPDNRDRYRTFRIAAVRPGNVVLTTLDNSVDGQTYADTLPTRECFPEGLNYKIRAEDEWVVRGSESGYVSQRTSALGHCVPRYDADTAQLGGRLEPGGLHVGPYLAFFLHEGSVPPIRRPDNEYSYDIGVKRFFDATTFEPSTVLPSDVMLVRNANNGTKLLVSDASDDFVWIRNFKTESTLRLQ